MKRILQIILCLFIGITALNAEPNPKAFLQIVNSLEKGEKKAIELITKQIKKDKKEAQWYWFADDYYESEDNTDARIGILKQALSVKKLSQIEETQLRLAMAYFDAGNYKSADSILAVLKQNKKVTKLRRNCIIADSLKRNPIEVIVTDMGDSINTPYDNIWPFASTDKEHFLSTVVIGKKNSTPDQNIIQEDIFVSTKKNGKWQYTEVLNGPMRTNENEGAQSISADGNYIFYVACNRRENIGSCDIYYIIKNKNTWSKPINAGSPLNTRDWESTPCISAGNSVIYFSSNRPGGYGGKDIWESTISKTSNGQLIFSEPKNLGPKINTSEDEISPYIDPYGKYLYFSSTGHGGMGKFDVFYTQKNKNEEWTEAKNIGYPINTHKDEFGFTLDVDGLTAYLSCNGYEQFSANKRIFSIRLPKSLQINRPLENKGDTIILEKIYFDVDMALLKPESAPSLENLLDFLIVHPNYNVEISGHTDNSGTREHNQSLSLARAKAVVEYLTRHNISPSRLTYVGYGMDKPIASNDTDEGRAKNRRIEIRIKR